MPICWVSLQCRSEQIDTLLASIYSTRLASGEPVDKEDRAKMQSGLRLTILVSHTDVERGASISVQLALVNEGARDVTVTFTSSQRFDLVVKDAAGHEVFHWSAGMFFVQSQTAESRMSYFGTLTYRQEHMPLLE